jgi:hypothetical protein
MGCRSTPRPEAAVVVAANAALPELLRVYSSAGLACVAEHETRADAEACIARVERDWAPVWTAWRTARTAVQAYEAGRTGDREAAARVAFCGLADAARRASGTALPGLSEVCR